jgi:hypothetical protein
MARLFPYLMGGLAAVALMELGPATVNKALSMTDIGVQHGSQIAQISPAQRKGDRLDHLRSATHPPDIATVELVGLRETAIVYRDRDGRELFRTDPLRNVTVVTKGLVLPSVTVRERGDSPVTPLPMPVAPSAVPARKPTGPAFGCESSFSPVAAPSMAHHTGRCMASLGSAVMIALAD